MTWEEPFGGVWHLGFTAATLAGHPVEARAMIYAFADGEEASKITAEVHFRVMLDAAGISWRDPRRGE